MTKCDGFPFARWEFGITIRQRIVLATNSVCRLARFARFVPIDLLGWLSWWLLSQHAHTHRHTEDNCYTPPAKLLSYREYRASISLFKNRLSPKMYYLIGEASTVSVSSDWKVLSLATILGTSLSQWNTCSIALWHCVGTGTYVFISCTNEPHTHHTICVLLGEMWSQNIAKYNWWWWLHSHRVSMHATRFSFGNIFVSFSSHWSVCCWLWPREENERKSRNTQLLLLLHVSDAMW